MSTTSTPRAALGVHLVGSICGTPNATTAFHKCITAFPSRLRRLPDGEPGDRHNWIGFQHAILAQHIPFALNDWDPTTSSASASASASASTSPPLPSPTTAAQLLPNPLETGYDTAALASYAAFTAQRLAGVIGPRTRFQVCFPTAASVMLTFVAGRYQRAIEPLYEAALVRALDKIQAGVPQRDLAVQVDVACEIAAVEGIECVAPYPRECGVAYWAAGPRMAHVVERVAVLAARVGEGVEFGVHLCYGDLGHGHFGQPRDCGVMVELAGTVLRAVGRRVDWLHLPVPRGRVDEAYLAPLRGLGLGETELYLGLVHAADAEGTERRLRSAERVLGHRRFGVGTECGMGRTPPEEFESIGRISTAVSSPVV